MPGHITDAQIESLMEIGDFVSSCDEAFRLYGRGELINLPRSESVTRQDGSEVFRLDLAGEWGTVLSGKKIIIERSDVGTGRLGERAATIELILGTAEDPVRLDAELITNRRTGAAAALGAHYLAGSTDSVAVVGTGRIAESVVLAADYLLSPAQISVTSRSEDNRRLFVERLGRVVRADLKAVQDVREVVSDADVVVATVPTPEPILSNRMLRSDAHLSVVAGDPRTVQLEADVLRNRPVVVDHYDQAMKSGDFLRYADQVPSFDVVKVGEQWATIGDASLGRLEDRRGTGCVTYFTGMAVQDLHAAYSVLSKLGVGI